MLAATLRVDDYLDLEALKKPPPYSAFDPLSVGTPPSPPSASDFAIEGPSTLGRVFAASKHAARAEQRQAEYEQALYGYRAAAQQHTQRLEKARFEHDADVARRREEHRKQVEEVSALQRSLAARQPEAVVRYLDLVLEAAEYPDGFPHEWRLAYTAGSGHLAIEYELPGVDVVPTDKAYKYVKASDTVSPSARPVDSNPQYLRRSAPPDCLAGRARGLGGRPGRSDSDSGLQRVRPRHQPGDRPRDPPLPRGSRDLPRAIP